MAPNPPQFSLEKAIRPNILSLEPYRCARDDYDSGILLDANENAIGHSLPPPDGSSSDSFDSLDLNRYPSPLHLPLKQLICNLRQPSSAPTLTPSQVFLGVGSDEIIDLLFRITCRPGYTYEKGGDRVLVTPPTYGMYKVTAKVNDVGVVEVPLDVEGGKFLPKVDEINEILTTSSTSPNPIKLLFLCSPGNPTGTLIPISSIRSICANKSYQGLVVVDEAYIDFADADKDSAVRLLLEEGWSNLVVMQTLSKGFGLAGIRLGLAISSPEIVQVLNNIKAPYNISTPTASLGYRALSPSGISLFRRTISTLNSNRALLTSLLLSTPGVLNILGAGHANFLVCQIGVDGKPNNEVAKRVYEIMARGEVDGVKGKREEVVVRFRGNELGCEGCVRITVGTEREVREVVKRLGELLKGEFGI